MSEKIYVGKGKNIGNYGDIRLNICLNDFNNVPKMLPNEKGWLPSLILKKMQKPDAKGNEYTIFINEFKPVVNVSGNGEVLENSDLPF
jgi:hypothetical protein